MIEALVSRNCEGSRAVAPCQTGSAGAAHLYNAGGAGATGKVAGFLKIRHAKLNVNLGVILGKVIVYAHDSITIFFMKHASISPKPIARSVKVPLRGIAVPERALRRCRPGRRVTWAAWTLPRDSMTRGVGWWGASGGRAWGW